MNKPFEIVINQEVAKVTDNYYEPLGISQERAKYLMDALVLFIFNVVTSDSDDTDLLDMFVEVSKLAETKEELAFIMFKSGEYHNALDNDDKMQTSLKLQFLKLALKKQAADALPKN